MPASLFAFDDYWIIGAKTKAAIPQSEFPPDIVAMIDLLQLGGTGLTSLTWILT